jgi:radical SAM superfamily enzyme YgiQ (UPF0313 family)
LPDCPVCAGGYLPTYAAREMMEESDAFDFAVKREGELTFLELVNHLSRHDGRAAPAQLREIQGLIYRDGDQIVENPDRAYAPDLDLLPFPSRDVLEERGFKLAQISTSRGCRLDCTFCVARSFWGTWRGRSPRHVVDEMERLYRAGIRHFNFIDNSFEDPDKACDRMMTIARGIIDSGMQISWVADGRAELHRKLSPEMTAVLKRSGLRSLFVGIEAANPADLRLYAKACGVEDVFRCMEFFPRHGIRVRPGFMNFNPYSTIDGLRMNIEFLGRFGLAGDFYRLVSRYALESGGRLYARVEGDSLLLPGAWDDPFRYRFVDERVAVLYTFLAEAVARLDEEYGIAARVHSCEEAGLEILNDLSQVDRAEGGGEADSIHALRESYLDFLSTLSAGNTTMFRRLLDLAESGWSRAKADRVVETLLHGPELSRDLGELEGGTAALFSQGGIRHPVLNALLGNSTPQPAVALQS